MRNEPLLGEQRFVSPFSWLVVINWQERGNGRIKNISVCICTYICVHYTRSPWINSFNFIPRYLFPFLFFTNKVKAHNVLHSFEGTFFLPARKEGFGGSLGFGLCTGFVTSLASTEETEFV